MVKGKEVKWTILWIEKVMTGRKGGLYVSFCGRDDADIRISRLGLAKHGRRWFVQDTG